MKPVIFVALALVGCGDILPLCDAKDNAMPWAHPEHWPEPMLKSRRPLRQRKKLSSN